MISFKIDGLDRMWVVWGSFIAVTMLPVWILYDYFKASKPASTFAGKAGKFLIRTPVALHNVGSLVLTYANAHFGASIQNFYRSESQLGRPGHYIEKMAAAGAPEVRNGLLKVPAGAGLGLEIDSDFLKQNLVDGESYWA